MAILAAPRVKSSHWYRADGTPCHSVTKANGDGERATTLADARKLGLIPSVTTILGVMAKEALTTWKVNQAILAAIKSPKQESESDDYYCKRIADASMEQVTEAADLGSDIHHALESWLNDKSDPPRHLAQYIAPVIEWFSEKKIRVTDTETTLVNLEQGYAGTADVLFLFGRRGRGVIDFKTRKTTPGKAIAPYDGQAMQLAAYAAAKYGIKGLDDVLIANIYISTTEPGRIEVVKHDDVFAHYLAFSNCCALWRYLKGYDPRNAGKGAHE